MVMQRFDSVAEVHGAAYGTKVTGGGDEFCNEIMS